MPKLPTLSADAVIKLLKKKGFILGAREAISSISTQRQGKE